MVYYKKRYAKRRGTTRYRRRTYRRRYTPYKKRRFVYSKASKAEWKQTMPVSATQSLTIANHTYGTSLAVNPSSANSMLVGANPGQRIGRKLNANFFKLRWQADIIDEVAAIDSMSIRFIAIQVKGNPAASPMAVPYLVSDLFPSVSATQGPAHLSWQLATISPFKDGITNSCRVLFDKTYKLNANSTTSQVIFKRKIRMQPLKWEIASRSSGQTDPTYNVQASNPVFFYWIVTNSVQSSSDTAVPLNLIYRLVYTDS